MAEKRGKRTNAGEPAPTSTPPASPWNPGGLARTNSWQNLLTGVGVQGKDKRLATGYAASPQLDQKLLRSMYRFDGLSRRIVDMPAEEMLRNGFTLTGDPKGKVEAHFEEIGVHRAVLRLLKWSRAFGGSLGVLGLKDGDKLDKPLNEAKLQSLDFIHPYQRFQVQWTSGDLYADPMNPKFGTPQWYSVYPIQGPSFRVHETRTVRLDGEDLDDQSRVENNGWGDSYLQKCFEQLRQVAGAFNGAEIIVEDFIQAVLSIKNLQEMLATPEGADLVRKRLDLMDLSRHVLHMKLLDANGEEYEKHASSVAGLPDLLDRFALHLSSATGIPVTKLFGRSPSGLNATGESDLRNWYDDLHADQEAFLSPIYERLCYLVFVSKQGGFGGKEPEDWKIEWNPLYQLTEKEEAEVYKTTADGDNVYLQNGTLNEEEVRQRFVGRGFGGLTVESVEPPKQEGGGEGGDDAA